jgi:hypothetical protein
MLLLKSVGHRKVCFVLLINKAFDFVQKKKKQTNAFE